MCHLILLYVVLECPLVTTIRLSQKRSGEWGAEKFNKVANEFLKKRSEQSKSWMNINEIRDFEGLSEIYNDMLTGDVEPKLGLIVNLNK